MPQSLRIFNIDIFVVFLLALPRLTSHPSSTTPQATGKLSSPTQQQGSSNAPGPPVSLANLPRLLSQITGNKEQPDITPQKALQTIQTAILLSRQVREHFLMFLILRNIIKL